MTQSSSNFKAHYLSALARSLFTNSSQIFINSVFVNTLGGKSYSDLFFFASLFTIVYYVFFAIAGERKAYWLYKGVLMLSFVGLVLFFVQPVCKPVLYYFAIAVIVVDLIGTNLGPIVLQASVNPSIFRELFQRIVSVELIARISAAGFVCLLSQFHLGQVYFAVAAVTLAAHFLLFGSALKAITAAPQAGAAEAKSSLSFIETIKSSLQFILANPLARIALTIMVWTHVTKFLVEYLFYQVAASNFQTSSQIASFVSATTMTMIVASLLVQRLIGRKLTERLQLSTLFSIQPINILLFGCIALLTTPFWTLVTLMVTYQCINRSIQLPVSRQCLLPIPRTQRGSIASLFSLFMAVAALVTSGIMSALKGSLVLHDFLFLLLFLSVLIFFLLTRMDAFYIRNLWSFYREGRSGIWSEMPFASGLCPDEMALSEPETDTWQTNNNRMELEGRSILHTYATSFDRNLLARATVQHQSLLKSNRPESVLQGLRISFVSGFPWCRADFTRHLSDLERSTSEIANRVLLVNKSFTAAQPYSSNFRRKVKTLALESLEAGVQDDFHQLQRILQISSQQSAELLVAAMAESRFKEIRRLLLRCCSEDRRKVSLSPIIEDMISKPYSDTATLRQVLESLSEAKDNLELLQSIKTGIDLLRQANFSFWTAPTDLCQPPAYDPHLQRFMHTLFLEEYRLSRHGLDRTFTDTISEFASLEREEALLLVDMHLEYLKSSELFNSWVILLQKSLN